MLQARRLAALAIACAALASTVPATAQESTDPIKLTLHDWTGQLITTNLMGEVLKKAGYNVEYVQADYLAQFAGLKPAICTLAWRCGKPRVAKPWTRRPQPERSKMSGQPACRPRKSGGFPNI